MDENDADAIAKYKIKTVPAEIPLLNEAFVFEGVADIVTNVDLLTRYLWNENDYLVLNVVYKTRNNPKKLVAALEKHERKLLALSRRILEQRNNDDHILRQANIVGESIQHYFAVAHTDDAATTLCRAFEPTIMIQRMLAKAIEIRDNQIVVSEYSNERGLVAKVSAMAVIDYIETILGASDNGYSINKGVLSAASFGVPQKRMRFVIIGVKKENADCVELPTGTFTENNYLTVRDAICDLEEIDAVQNVTDGDKGIAVATPRNISNLGRQLRDSKRIYNHVSTATTTKALERFKAIKQGGNFHTLGDELKTSYSDPSRTQNTIYLRLNYDEPSGTVVNVRKSMWIHPVKHRALSIREAARLQTFPDSFVFCGTKDSQYQQVGNAVPPILARAIAEQLCRYLDKQPIGLTVNNDDSFTAKSIMPRTSKRLKTLGVVSL